MSEDAKELWAVSGQYIVRGALRIGEIYGAFGKGPAIQARIVADHNACIGIDDPETTVPELVAMCGILMLALDDASQYKGEFLREKHGDDDLLTEAGELLTKTGRQNDPQKPQHA